MLRTRHRLLVAVVATLTLVLAGCGGDGDGETADPAADAPTDSTDDAEGDDDAGDETADGDMASSTVAIASSDFGDILVDGEGRTLYMFLPDQGGEPTCTDDCAAAWPVFEGPADAGDGADGSLLDTATHPSGATQATYRGWPLYYFASDAGPGEVNGQGVNDVWFVLGPDGEPIRDDANASGQGLGY